MIRFIGTKDNGQVVVIGLVLQAGNLERLKRGEPIMVDLRGMADSNQNAGLFTRPCELLIAYQNTGDFVVSELVKQAREDGAVIHTIPKGPEDPQ